MAEGVGHRTTTTVTFKRTPAEPSAGLELCIPEFGLGICITGARPGSQADRLGIFPGRYLVSSINGTDISHEPFARAVEILNRADPATLVLQSEYYRPTVFSFYDNFTGWYPVRRVLATFGRTPDTAEKVDARPADTDDVDDFEHVTTPTAPLRNPPTAEAQVEEVLAAETPALLAAPGCERVEPAREEPSTDADDAQVIMDECADRDSDTPPPPLEPHKVEPPTATPHVHYPPADDEPFCARCHDGDACTACEENSSKTLTMLTCSLTRTVHEPSAGLLLVRPLHSPGLLAIGAVPGSPAAESGLFDKPHKRYRIVAVNNQWVEGHSFEEGYRAMTTTASINLILGYSCSEPWYSSVYRDLYYAWKAEDMPFETPPAPAPVPTATTSTDKILAQYLAAHDRIVDKIVTLSQNDASTSHYILALYTLMQHIAHTLENQSKNNSIQKDFNQTNVQ